MVMKNDRVETQLQCVGIDMSMETFDVGISVGKKTLVQRFTVRNSGLNQFRNWLRKNNIHNPHLWIEATGRYWEGLAEWAVKVGFKVTVVNPRCIRHFAISKLKLNKTDPLDARTILRFGECAEDGEFRSWKPKTAALKELRDLQVEIVGLNKAIGQERNRLKCGLTSEIVKDSIKQTIAMLTSQKKRLQKESSRLIKSDAQLKGTYGVLKTIRGFGDVTIAFLLAKIDFGAFSKGRQLVKFAGLDSIRFESGKSVKKKERISRTGHADLRSALYWPAIVAIRDDEATAAFAQNIVARNCNMVAICAVMARLLRIAFARVRDSRKVFAQMPAT